MAGIHSFIYGIDAHDTVRKITVSKEAGATQMILNPLHGAAGAPVRTIVQNDRVPLEEAKRLFDLDEATMSRASSPRSHCHSSLSPG
jgi:hypothetical protein